MTEGTGRTYRVMERLGQGAFGAVYLAETEGSGLSRRVAIKVPHADRVSPAMIARLRDEARLLSLIRHRSIVRVDDLVELDGAWSVVMEYVEGCDVAELVVLGPIPPRPALAIAEEVAQALHAAYHQTAPDGTPIRLLHRDIKPSNLRVTAAGEVKILDFGVARADFSAREATATESVFGTSTYLAPERYHGEDSRAGDVYALGVTLFEMLAGVPPGKSAMDADRQPPGRRWAEQWSWLERVSPELRDLVASMLASDPQERPSARDCARSLGELRMSLGGTTLEDWAERVVPSRLRGTTRERDDRTGSLLIERSTSRAVKRTPVRSSPWMVGGALVAGVLIVTTAVAVGALWHAGWERVQVAEPNVAIPSVPVGPAPVDRAPPDDGDLELGTAANEGASAADILSGESPVALGGASGLDGAANPAVPGTAEGPTSVIGAPAGTGTPAGAGQTTTPPAGGGASAGGAAAGGTAASGTSTGGTSARGSAAAGSTAGRSTGGGASSASTTSPSAAAPGGGTSSPATPTKTVPSTSNESAAARTAATSAPPNGQGRLVVTGEVVSVHVLGTSGLAKLGNVAPGTYDIEVTFASGERTTMEDVKVAAGQTVNVKCSPTFKSCKTL